LGAVFSWLPVLNLPAFSSSMDDAVRQFAYGARLRESEALTH
jgi:hypothetical protein